MKYSYVIVDAFKEDVERMQATFAQFPDYACVGTAGDEDEAVDLILYQNPDLVFLDVEIPGNHFNMSLFTVISELGKYMNNPPTFIVVTATKAYAIDAIKNDVLDYFLKPFNGFQLRKALLRFEKKQDEKSKILCVKSHSDHKFINMDELLYLQADNNTTDLFISNGKKVSAFKTLKHFENVLPRCFVRIHNSYIINTKYITRIHFGKAKCAIQHATGLIPFSKSYKNNVERIKNDLSPGNLVHA